MCSFTSELCSEMCILHINVNIIIYFSNTIWFPGQARAWWCWVDRAPGLHWAGRPPRGVLWGGRRGDKAPVWALRTPGASRTSRTSWSEGQDLPPSSRWRGPAGEGEYGTRQILRFTSTIHASQPKKSNVLNILPHAVFHFPCLFLLLYSFIY